MRRCFTDMELAIIHWAEARKIIPNSTPATQLLKLVSEVGEVADEQVKGNVPAMKTEVGDVMVTLVVFCALHDIDLVDCMNLAYDKIKDRKGTLLANGVFLKEGD